MHNTANLVSETDALISELFVVRHSIDDYEVVASIPLSAQPKDADEAVDAAAALIQTLKKHAARYGSEDIEDTEGMDEEDSDVVHRVVQQS